MLLLRLNITLESMVLFSEDHIQETKRRGRIEVICGSMFSGKTEELIRTLLGKRKRRQQSALVCAQEPAREPYHS